MSTTTSREIRLASRPRGLPTADNFALAQVELAPPQDGQVLVRNLYISADPYMPVGALLGLFQGQNVGKMVVDLA